MKQNPSPDFTAHLTDRRLVRVTGEDANTFLQNIVTNDLRSVSAGQIVFACLLTPQGAWLHDFFILADEGGYILDCEASRADDLLRRFTVFKLRSRVSFSDVAETQVYATTKGGRGYPDPRREGLGYRIYTKDKLPAEPLGRYYDFCIEQGVPCGSLTIKPEKETMADVSLDLLNAVAWDKGCFVGQEVAARMHNRGLTKRRLFVVLGDKLKPGVLKQGDIDVGEIRQVNSTGDKALAVIKLAAASQKDAAFTTAEGTPARLADA
jgi:folate-binding protein YgfZ